MTTAAQNKAIHALVNQTGLPDDDYRALLSRYGKASSKDLSDGDALDLIEGLRKLPGARPRAARASGRYAPILRALWLSAWNLGLVRSSDDRAMTKFVERQTGLAHTRFLVEQADAARAIEALKAWIRREAGVEWPKTVNEHHRKRAVVEAIVRRLRGLGLAPLPAAQTLAEDMLAFGAALGLPPTLELYTNAEWDKLANHLGKRLRGALSREARRG